jgi:hypothetical protein
MTITWLSLTVDKITKKNLDIYQNISWKTVDFQVRFQSSIPGKSLGALSTGR